jgi:hypothetical protein
MVSKMDFEIEGRSLFKILARNSIGNCVINHKNVTNAGSLAEIGTRES